MTKNTLLKWAVSLSTLATLAAGLLLAGCSKSDSSGSTGGGGDKPSAAGIRDTA